MYIIQLFTFCIPCPCTMQYEHAYGVTEPLTVFIKWRDTKRVQMLAFFFVQSAP